MNLRISKAAAVLFIFSFFFSACDDPTAIGLELQEPGTQIGTSYTDTATIKASTVLLKDSIVGLGATRVQVGRITDGTFGTVTARTFGEFAPMTLPAHPDSIDATRGADSLIINLDYNYAFGDRSKNIKLNVHRLTEAFRDDDTYFTSRRLTYNETPVGSVTFLPQPDATYKSPTDTSQSLPVLIRIKITGNFANDVLQALAQNSASQPFINTIRGLVIEPAPGTEGQGTMIGFLPTSTSTTLALHYKSKKNLAKVTTFMFTDRYFNQIEANRNGTGLATLQNNGATLSSEAAGNRTYLQAGTGLVTKIDLPHISYFREKDPIEAARTGKKQDQNLAVNKAELIIPLINGADSLSLPPVITVVEATRSNRIAMQQGVPSALVAEGSNVPATLQYRGKNGGYVYVVNITSYIQNLLYNRRENNGLILLPSNVTSTVSTPTNMAQTINRAIIEANQSPNAERKIRLRLFYSTAQ
ncbi:DUF4270 family protein [Rufibacter tibetensis]|uniref:DUF4270 domain-containing protein n=1 Tax=Rufibacter tibetensis TaxID=512763 RepID=A0A0N7HWD7_9BACT|nr:DUF4270 family protein [Rufibacter tibetensis]ALI98960.1 hypothetical protein DC20_08195 [Rufibacter tibetensis]